MSTTQGSGSPDGGAGGKTGGPRGGSHSGSGDGLADFGYSRRDYGGVDNRVAMLKA
jgi:hypothetical protein